MPRPQANTQHSTSRTLWAAPRQQIGFTKSKTEASSDYDADSITVHLNQW